jgi:hypothetical protein
VNERLSRAAANVLAHRAGLLWFNVFTLAWFAVPALIGVFVNWHVALVFELVVFLPGYLDVVTWFSGATQFTIAFQNSKAQTALDETLETLLQLARNDVAAAGAIVAQAEAIWTAVGTIDDTIDRLNEAVAELLKLARTEQEIQTKLAKQDESIVTTLSTVRDMLEGQELLAHRLAEPLGRLIDEGTAS